MYVIIIMSTNDLSRVMSRSIERIIAIYSANFIKIIFLSLAFSRAFVRLIVVVYINYRIDFSFDFVFYYLYRRKCIYSWSDRFLL